jgi:hypothetical protein
MVSGIDHDGARPLVRDVTDKSLGRAVRLLRRRPRGAGRQSQRRAGDKRDKGAAIKALILLDHEIPRPAKSQPSSVK